MSQERNWIRAAFAVFAVLCVALGLLLSPLPTPTGAQALSVHQIPQPTISIDPTSGYAGSLATVTGVYFPENFKVTVTIGSLYFGSALTDLSGQFTLTSVIPALEPGQHKVVAQYVGGTASTAFTVLEPPGTPTPTPSQGDICLTFQVEGCGSTTPSVGTHCYSRLWQLAISATPCTGWEFEQWIGDVADPYSPTTTVTATSGGTFTAVFVESESSGVEEHVATPGILDGPTTGEVDQALTYSWPYTLTSAGHPVQHCIDWGDGNVSAWMDSGVSDARVATHSWDEEGVYAVRAQARCAIHTSIHSAWSGEKWVTITTPHEEISAPSAPTGPSTGEENESLTFSTGNATSSLGHPLEYRFDWGDGDFSEWSSSTTASHSWSEADTYPIKAQARCAEHTYAVSEWSNSTSVAISIPEETISTPSRPSGPISGEAGQELSFQTEGAVSNLAHPVEYRFDWGDGTMSAWMEFGPFDTGWTPHSWGEEGDYAVRAQARCTIHTTIVSDWSEPKQVSISGPEDEDTGLPNGEGVVPTPRFALSNLEVTPAETEPGGNVTICVEAANVGEAAGTQQVSLLIDGEMECSQMLTLAAGETRVIPFTVSRDAVGSYTVAVEDLPGQFEVLTSTPGMRWYIVGGIVAGTSLVALLLLLLLLPALKRVARWVW